MSFHPGERAELCTTLESVGPQAPTLDEGWLTRDLAAHLVLRERRPDAAPGIALTLLGGWTAAVQRRLAQRPWDELVGQIRSGPPPWSPFSLPGVGEAANLTELFVHHEDVRRAQPQWSPRQLPAGMDEALAAKATGVAKLAYRRLAARLVLVTPQGGEAVVGRGGGDLVVSGPGQELLLWAFGRRDHALVSIEGDVRPLERLRGR